MRNKHLEHTSLENLHSARFLKPLNALSVGSLQNENCMYACIEVVMEEENVEMGWSTKASNESRWFTLDVIK